MLHNSIMIASNIIHKKSAGGIVHSNGKFLTLYVTKYGEVVFPKGTIELDETPEQAAIREISEETGYRVRIKAPLGRVSYEFNEDDGKQYKKLSTTISLSLLMKTNSQNLIVKTTRMMKV